MADATSGLLAASNPYMAAANMGLDALKSVTGGPTSAEGQSTSSFDSSGWNVNFGGGSIDSTRAQTPASAAGRVDQYLPYALAFAGLLAVWRMTRKH